MRTRIFLSLIIIFLAGCITPYWQEEWVSGVPVIYTNRVREFCDGANGCYRQPPLNIIFVRRGDRETLREELLHAEGKGTHGTKQEELFDFMLRRISPDPTVGLQ